jgi:hypothetical protein
MALLWQLFSRWQREGVSHGGTGPRRMPRNDRTARGLYSVNPGSIRGAPPAMTTEARSDIFGTRAGQERAAPVHGSLVSSKDTGNDEDATIGSIARARQ